MNSPELEMAMSNLAQDFIANVRRQGDMALGDEQAFRELWQELVGTFTDADLEVFNELFGKMMVLLVIATMGADNLSYFAFQYGMAWERYRREHEEAKFDLDGIKGL